MPDKTVEAWRNLWFHTGDRVLREKDGQFRFLDRLKDAIRRRGENISSFEVEQVLISHPEIAAAAVFPVRSELAEDEVMAAILRKPESRLSELELIALLRAAPAALRAAALPRIRHRAAAHGKRQGAKIQAARARHRPRNLGP